MCTTVHGYTTFVYMRRIGIAKELLLCLVCVSARLRSAQRRRRERDRARRRSGHGEREEDVVVREMRGTEKHF